MRGSARRSIRVSLHLLRALGGNPSFWIAARHAGTGLPREPGTPSWPHRSAVEGSAERPVLASCGAFNQCASMDASTDKRESAGAFGDAVARTHAGEPGAIEDTVARRCPIFG